jgi:hypothetical protein
MSDGRHTSGATNAEGRSDTDSLLEGFDSPRLAELMRLGDAHLRRLARAYPIPVLLGALAAGYVAARLSRAANR